MTKLKSTYLDSKEKIAVRDFLFSLFKFKNIVGLVGPDINECLDKYINYGFKNITVYERDVATFIKQMQVVVNYDFNYVLGDVFHANADLEDTLYDLDYCVTVRYMTDHIAKFTKNFIMTFSKRISDEESISTFFEARGEKLIFEEPRKHPIPHTILHANNGSEYVYVSYRHTSNMFCIAKIK
jgi:hypothetical protein